MKALAFFPGMQIPVDEKLARVDSYLELFQRHFDVVPVGRARRARSPSATSRSARRLRGRVVTGERGVATRRPPHARPARARSSR